MFAWVLFYLCDAKIYDYLTQNLITFFSIAFGFYITSVAVLYNAEFTKNLYAEVDSKRPTQRKIHTIKKYFEFSSLFSIFSVVSILLYSSLAEKEQDGLLRVFHNFQITFNDYSYELQSDRILASVILAISTMNILVIFLVIRIFLNGLLHEAKIKTESQP